MLRIIQTYHGTGGPEGYRFVLEKYINKNDRYVKIGELEHFPSDYQKEIFNLNGIEYIVTDEYEVNDTPEDDEIEKMVLVLEEYKPKIQERYRLKIKK